MENNEKNKNHKTRDIIIMIIIIIIIILLLLHNCVLNGKKNNGDTHTIDICDGKDCEVKPGLGENYIDCLTDVDNEYCIVPDFKGKTKKDVDAWLSKILNNLDLDYDVIDSMEKDGIILDQSAQKGLTVKELLDGNIPLIITFSNTKNAKVDCLVDVKNEACIIPDFTGKTKDDVIKWLDGISNNINVKYSSGNSDKKDGTIFDQSTKKTTVKDLLDNNKLLEVVFSNNDKVDCLKDEFNEACIIPNFKGDTKEDIEKWLNSISNDVNVNYSTKESNSKNGTVIDQSSKPGSTIKDLITSGKSLDIVFANRDDSKVDCLTNPNSKNCIIPDFTGKTKQDIDKWLDGIVNDFGLSYVVQDTNKESGTVVNQSDKNVSIKELIDSNKTLVINISNFKNSKVDCLAEVNNPACVVPDFTGKTQKDVNDWLDSIANNINATFEEKKSNETNGTVIEQSVTLNTTVKDLIESGTPINIVYSNNNKVDCLKDVYNEACIIPNFTGDTKDKIEEWLNTLTNKINVNYKTSESTSTKGTVVEQSPKAGTTIKDLINSKKPLDISFAGEQDARVDCLKDVNNAACIVPDFTGKTQKDVNEWLSKISNNIKTNYGSQESDKKAGTIINQSPKSGKTVKDILDGNGAISLTIAKEPQKDTKVDCLKDINNKLCIIPDFTGKTKEEVNDWLSNISNNVKVNYNEEESNKNPGTITNQSPKSGKTVKDILSGNGSLDITVAKAPQDTRVNCLVDTTNAACIVPDFTGKTQQDVNDWLSNILNNVTVNYTEEESNKNPGTIINQSPSSGKTIKDIIDEYGSLNITVAKEQQDSKVNCLVDTTNAACIIPDFTGKTQDEVNEWLDKISNSLNVVYEEEYSSEDEGTITKQTPSSGSTVKDLLDNNTPLVITKSNGEEEGELIVSDNNLTWTTDTNLNIFGETNAKIAPESSDTYRFEVKNNTSYKIKYNITFTETNPYNINMKYKLRKNNTYLFDDYVSVSELNASNIIIDSSKSDTYYLEWKWVSSDNDTEVGKAGNATYTLKINIDAESING